MSKYKEFLRLLDSKENINAKEVREVIDNISKEIDVSVRFLARGLGLDEPYFLQMENNRTKSYMHDKNIDSLERLVKVIDFAEDSLSKEGVKKWLREPNQYLDGAAPIFYLHSDEERDKVLSLLASIRYGYPS
jgi:hypothetical protein